MKKPAAATVSRAEGPLSSPEDAWQWARAADLRGRRTCYQPSRPLGWAGECSKNGPRCESLL